jgi:hypothetical protein
MRRLPLLIVMAALLFGLARPVQAQSGVVVSGIRVEYNFGVQITFSAQIQSFSPIQEILLLFRDEHETVTRVYPAQLDANGQASYRYDASQNALRPFAPIQFWFQVTLQNGQSYSSQNYTFIYADNRFDWQALEDGALHVHWYAGDAAFGQAALDTSRAGLQRIGELIPLNLDQPIEVYLYASAADLQEALSLGGGTWVAGHANPELGVVLVAVAGGQQQRNLMEQLIPHELAHVLLYRKLGTPYNRLPAWLSEGIATISELYPNPDYPHALNQARQDNQLIPIASLCQGFPPETSQAFLAYAESASFTRYLYDTFGNSGLERLLNSYADGLNCEQGAARALGLTLTQLDSHWRESVLGENPAGMAARNLWPYVIVLLLILAFPAWGILKIVLQRKEN